LQCVGRDWHIATIPVAPAFVRYWGDCVAKVESCRAKNFSENTKREAIADSYNFNRVTEVACEFFLREAMRSLTSLHESRACSPQNF